MKKIIHWQEGLFLQPQHLQVFQREILESQADLRRSRYSGAYGLLALAFSRDELDNGKVVIEHLSAVFPSGMQVDFPANSELPPRDIREKINQSPDGFTVFAAVPVWEAHRANTILDETLTDPRSQITYRIREKEVFDENTGDNPQQIQLRAFNTRILLEGESTEGFEVVPLFRILPGIGDGSTRARVDNRFCPPCLSVQASPVLLQNLRDITAQVEAARQELVVQINRGGFHLETLQGMRIEQMLRLRTLNHYTATLTTLIAQPFVEPLQFFIELKALLGELAAGQPDKDPFINTPFQSDNPLRAFRPVMERIRELLKGGIAPSFTKIPFKSEGRLLRATLEEAHFTGGRDFFLAVKSKRDSKEVIALVEDANRFKMMPPSLATKVVFGVPLKEERIPPMELPSQPGMIYFRMLVQEREQIWSLVRKEGGVTLLWPGMDASDFQTEIYITSNQA